MALIKRSHSKDLLKNAVVLDLADLNRQAERIMNDARASAEQIVQQGRDEAQKLIDQAAEVGHEQGYERGYAEGLHQGYEQGRQEVMDSLKSQLEAIVRSWNKALEQWETDREELLLQAREDVVTFAFALGCKLTGRMIKQDSTIVRDQLTHALRLLGEPSSLSVYVHPDDKALIDEVLPELLTQFAKSEHAAVRGDSAISRGGCRITSAGGEVDATIETQLARLAEALLPTARSQQFHDRERSEFQADEGEAGT